MEHDVVASLHEKSHAWRLLRARNAPLVLSFLGRVFVEDNAGALPLAQVTSLLEDHLAAVNTVHEGRAEPYAGTAVSYLEDWAGPESGWLRRFYPPTSDDVHVDATPAFERAHAWVEALSARQFVGTESRLHTLVDLLRQIVHGSDADPATRLAELERRRAAIDAEIDDVRAGRVALLGGAAVRERYQHFSTVARELLSDFREVEENFRGLDRAARERIATWGGSKGELLENLVGDRTDITASDQGRSFQAFYDFLLSQQRQDELSDLLARVQDLPDVEADRRTATVHHEWFDAAERTQQTVRGLSEQLRRFLDDQVWLENRRIMDLVRAVEAHAIAVRDAPPPVGLDVDAAGVDVALPFERPLYEVRAATEVHSAVRDADEEVELTALFDQTFVDQRRLKENIRAVVPRRGAALLTDIVDLFPVQDGIAEIVAYLALSDDDLEVVPHEHERVRIGYADATGAARTVRLPQVTVHRR